MVPLDTKDRTVSRREAMNTLHKRLGVVYTLGDIHYLIDEGELRLVYLNPRHKHGRITRKTLDAYIEGKDREVTG